MRALRAGQLLVDEPVPGVVRLTISNPGKRGALDHAILDAFAARMPELDARCVVVTGAGDTFSAGYDIGNLPGAVAAEKLVAHPFAAAIEAIAAYPFPTLAAIGGPAIGGGLELALACDLRIAARGVYFAMPPGKLGLVYSHTGIGKFIEVVGAARTRELFLAGRRVDEVTAKVWGLVNEVVDREHLADVALDRAKQIAADAPLAQRGNKRVIDEVLRAAGRLDERTERMLIELREASFASDDFREGIRAFAEKRAPRFKGN